MPLLLLFSALHGAIWPVAFVRRRVRRRCTVARHATIMPCHCLHAADVAADADIIDISLIFAISLMPPYASLAPLLFAAAASLFRYDALIIAAPRHRPLRLIARTNSNTTIAQQMSVPHAC